MMDISNNNTAVKPTFVSAKVISAERPLNSLAALIFILGYLVILLFFYMDWVPFLFGLAGCLFFLWLSMRYPDKAFIILLAISILLPIDLAVKVGSLPRLGPTRIALAIFLMGLLMRRIFWRDHSFEPRKWPLKKPIALFFLLAAASSVFSINPTKSLYSLLSFVFEQFLPFFIAFALLRKPGFFHSTKRWLYIITILVCGFAILEEIFHINPIMFIYPEESLLFRGEILRVRSTFFHPIAFGCFLTIVFPFVLVDFIYAKRKAKKLYLLILLASISISLFLTVSRGPWIGLIFGMAMLTLLWQEKGKFGKEIVISMALLALISGIWIYQINDTAQNSVDSFINPNAVQLDLIAESSSEYYRIALAKGIMSKMYGFRWLLGFGPGTFILADVGSIYAGHEHTLTAADSHFLKLFFEHGTLGLAAFIVLLVSIIRQCVKAVRPTKYRFNRNAAAATCAIACFIFENITVSMFMLFPLTMLFWLYTALVLPAQVSVSKR